MDWNWYQSAAVMALISSIGTIWELVKVRKHLHMNDLTPTRKWKKAISGSRYIPKHKPDKFSGYETEYERRFFSDFIEVADLLNFWYQDSPWSFENNGSLDSGLGSKSGAEREIEIQYNQQKTGVIKLSCINYEMAYSSNNRDPSSAYKIRGHLELINARHFEGYEVFHLATSLANIIDGEPETSQKIKSEMMMAMIHTSWQIGEEVFGNPPIEFSVSGTAQWYLNEWLPNHS
jgi:hypothetical protein